MAFLFAVWAIPVLADNQPQPQATPERSQPVFGPKIEELSVKQAEIAGEILTIKGSVRWLSERISIVTKDVASGNNASELLGADLKKTQAGLDRAIKQASAFADDLDSLKAKLGYLADESKVRSDDFRSLRENISSLKKSVDENTESLIDCRKTCLQLRDELNKSSRLTPEDPAGWPYWGVAGTAVGILALILAIVK